MCFPHEPASDETYVYTLHLLSLAKLVRAQMDG
jgi:hypothetical protein